MGHCSRCSDLRSQAFQFAALCTLPTTLSGSEVKIVQDLMEKFHKVRFIQYTHASDIEVPPSSYLLFLVTRLLRPLLHRSGLLS
jgi:hypothetical protein